VHSPRCSEPHRHEHGERHKCDNEGAAQHGEDEVVSPEVSQQRLEGGVGARSRPDEPGERGLQVIVRLVSHDHVSTIEVR
jgi:hypothetical protein